ELLELGADLGAVAGLDELADLLDERVRARLEALGLARREVPDVGVLAVVQRDQVAVLTKESQPAAAGPSTSAYRLPRGLRPRLSHDTTPAKDGITSTDPPRGRP